MVTHISLMPQRTGSRIAELCGTLDLAEIETSCSVVDCNDLDLILSKAINEAIVAQDDLSDVLNVQLWHNPPRAWELCQAIGSTERAIGEHRCNLRCVASDEEADRIKVI
jgi:hypothetical protein